MIDDDKIDVTTECKKTESIGMQISILISFGSNEATLSVSLYDLFAIKQNDKSAKKTEDFIEIYEGNLKNPLIENFNLHLNKPYLANVPYISYSVSDPKELYLFLKKYYGEK